MTDPLIGQQLANYRIERLIGRGGMAAVYYAVDVLLNRPAAVKVIHAYSNRPEAYTERLLREARSVAGWRNEHIIQVYHAGNEAGMFYFVMEYIDGQNLAEIMAAHTSQGELLPGDEVLRYGRAIADALDYAHARNVIHRDVKPQNVLVAGDGRVVLTDFGLALNTQQGSLGEVFGTAYYTAPEQARRSNAAVPASDLYSLGVMLYEMLVGVLPFDDPSPTSVALQHITLPPPPPRQINPQLSPQVEAVLLKAISKDPAGRYPSGKALVGALETAWRSQPVVSSRLPPLPPPPPPAALGGAAGGSRATRLTAHPAAHATQRRRSALRGKKGLWVGAGVGVLLFLLGAAAFLLLGRPDLEARQTPASLIGTGANPPGLAALDSTPVRAIDLSATEAPATRAAGPSPAAPRPATPLGGATPGVGSLPGAAASLTPSPLAASATPHYLNGRHFTLYYNASSFYMRQVSGFRGRIAPLIFERLNTQGHPSNRFSGDLWAQYNQATVAGWCMNIEILQAGNYLRPAECENRYLATRWPGAEADFIFWTAQEGSAAFRAVWDGEEVARCLIADGLCELYLP